MNNLGSEVVHLYEYQMPAGRLDDADEGSDHGEAEQAQSFYTIVYNDKH
jgi:hypothetical protein